MACPHFTWANACASGRATTAEQGAGHQLEGNATASSNTEGMPVHHLGECLRTRSGSNTPSRMLITSSGAVKLYAA